MLNLSNNHPFNSHSDYIHADLFATAAHAAVGQKRKNGGPYIDHPRRVAELVAELFPNDQAMKCAAVLHDVIEDTKVKKKLIAMIFGDDVAQLVSDITKVTKKTDGTREERQAIERAHLKQATLRAKIIKLCDIEHNLSDDPLADSAFMEVYVPEKRLVLTESLYEVRDAFPHVYNRVLHIIEDLENILGL